MNILRLILVSLPLLFAATTGYATTENNLKQIGLSEHNDLRQLVIGYTGGASYACSDGSVRFINVPLLPFEEQAPPPCNGNPSGQVFGETPLPCSDGSVRFIGGGTLLPFEEQSGQLYCADGSVRSGANDGSVRFISVDVGSQGAFCFSNVRTAGVTDGTSNTIAFGESFGLGVTPGFLAPDGSVRGVVDGSSNTILIGETPSSFCLGDTTIGDPVAGDITDGTSNTIFLGENSTLDVCFQHASIGRIADGTSNTILFGESLSNVCLQDVALLPNAVPEPSALALLLPVLACFGIVLGRYRQI